MYEEFFTEGHNLFRKTVREFVEKELAPHAEEWEEAGNFPREVFTEMGKLGFFGLKYPEKYGGAGLDYWYTVVFAEELNRSRMGGLNMCIMVQTDMATPALNELGTEEQKQEFLVPAIKGEKIAAIGVTEPDFGSDVASLKTTARRVGDEYIINGSKTFITNGTRADFINLAVRTGEEGYMGISFILFPTDVKGFSVGKKLKKMGLHTADSCELFFDDCHVPARYLLGEENQGFIYIMTQFQAERLIAAINVVAGMQYMWDEAVDYAKKRTVFGKPISKYQIWRHEFVDLLTEIEAGRQLTYHACDLYNRGKNPIKEISMAKLFVGELALKVASRCLQVHGGYGYTEDYDICRAYRDTRLITIGGGTSEIMKEIIRRIIGL